MESISKSVLWLAETVGSNMNELLVAVTVTETFETCALEFESPDSNHRNNWG